VVRDENGIGDGGEYCGGNDAQLGRINALYHEASDGKHVPRAVLFEPGVINAVTLSCRSATRGT
jgi:tubulin beta